MPIDKDSIIKIQLTSKSSGDTIVFNKYNIKENKLNNLILRGKEAELEVINLFNQWINKKLCSTNIALDVVNFLEENNVQFLITPKIKFIKEWTIVGTKNNYVVRKYNSGMYTCTCPLFESGRNKVCHHIKTAVIRLTDKSNYIFNPTQHSPIVINRNDTISVVYNKRALSELNLLMDKDAITLFLLLRHGWSISELKAVCDIGGTSSGLFEEIVKRSGMRDVVDACFLEDDEDGNNLLRHGKSWTISDVSTLERMFSAGKSIREIAKTLGRTKVAIRLRLQVIGYSEEEIFSRNR